MLLLPFNGFETRRRRIGQAGHYSKIYPGAEFPLDKHGVLPLIEAPCALVTTTSSPLPAA
jgi:hypothetical protein